MALDGLVVRAVVHELQRLVGGRVNKIHQPNDHDLVWHIRAGGTGERLLISASANFPRVHLTRRTFANPQEAPMFCMLMRKHCEGGVIEAISQVGLERIVHIDVRQRDELGDIAVKRVVVELMGRHSNIILTDPKTGLILDGIRHVTPAISSHRVVLPGSRYVNPPEQGKLNPLGVTEQAFFERWQTDPPAAFGETAAWLVRTFQGLSPLAAAEIVHRSAADRHQEARDQAAPPSQDAGEPNGQAVFAALRDYMKRAAAHEYFPHIVEMEDAQKSVFSVFPLTHAAGTVRPFASVSECVETYYGDKAERDAVKQKTNDLLRLLLNEKSKNEKKLEKLRQTLEEAQKADKWRIYGELLTAHLHELQRGDTQANVVNYYDEAQPVVSIPLDPQLTPAENAQRYFKKYTKSKNSLTAATEQIEAAKAEIAYLDTLLAQLDTASLSDVEEMREELEAGGYLRRRGGRTDKRKKSAPPRLEGYLSSEGAEIYVGKNNTQNDYLTMRFANGSDTWLHAKDMPGSHVVIRGRDFGDATLEEAAMIAAYYSKGRQSGRVPVDWTLVRHVRKPNGAKPGFVIYDHQKTVVVTPDEQRIRQLRKIGSPSG